MDTNEDRIAKLERRLNELGWFVVALTVVLCVLGFLWVTYGG